MNTNRLSLALSALLGGLALPVQALELYVDTKTQQVFTAPGKGRVRLGEFQQVDGPAASKTTPAEAKALESSLDKKKAELEALEARLDKKKDTIRTVERKIDAAAVESTSTEKKWYDKIGIKGYAQARYSQILSTGDKTDRLGLMSTTDRSIGQNQDLLLRRARLVVSGDVSDHLAIYLQGDFSAGLSGPGAPSSGDSTTQGNYFQMRDYYGDVYFDHQREYRVRVGQSKVPFGWENLQSSQNRVALERADALDSTAVRDERDLGVFAYWTPSAIQDRFKYLQKSGMRGSGDYGVLGLGIYNGQGANRFENNDNFHLVARATWPFELPGNQFLEVGASGYMGRYMVSPATIAETNVRPTIRTSGNNQNHGVQDDRYAVHAILYPRPFGLQAEWTMGHGPRLFNATTTNPYIAAGNVSGGYVQAMYKIDHWYGTWVPYVKWETYDGGTKFDNNSPMAHFDQLEGGIEWQPMPEVELTAAYSHMDRTNTSAGGVKGDKGKQENYRQYAGDVLRLQLQYNY